MKTKPWKKLLFPLFTLAILLAGALAATLAALAVVFPPVGKTVSAGVLAVPTVAGLTADELQFPPWDMYDLDRHVTVPLSFLSQTSGVLQPGIRDMTFSELLERYSDIEGDMLDLIPFAHMDFQMDELFQRLEWNLPEGTLPDTDYFSDSIRMYLKGLPCTMTPTDSGATQNVTLDLALEELHGSLLSLTCVLQPAVPQTLTESEQEAARTQVESDVLDLLRIWDIPLDVDTFPHAEALYEDFTNSADVPQEKFSAAWSTLFGEDSALGIYLWQLMQSDLPLSPIQDFFLSTITLSNQLGLQDNSDLELRKNSMEQTEGWSIQIVSTPSQVLVLFSHPGRQTFGVFYDIQMGCYSGFGITS